MARIRTIKPEFWTNERVMECSVTARLLFIGMWNFADDLGRLPLSAKTIKAQIFPSDDISGDAILRMVGELSTNGLVLTYEVDGRQYIQIVGWQHQRIDKPQPGKCPGPVDGYSKSIHGMVATEGKGEEGKGEEGNSKANALGAHAPRERADERFAEFWLAYPRRDGPNPRKPAEQRFSSLVKAGVDPGMMIEAAKKLAVDEAARGNVGTRFIPQAVTWLNQQRWADHAAVAAQQQAEAAEHLASQVHVKADTPQWRAWASHLGKSPPQDRNFGWYFDSEWPPGHVPKGAGSTA